MSKRRRKVSPEVQGTFYFVPVEDLDPGRPPGIFDNLFRPHELMPTQERLARARGKKPKPDGEPHGIG